MRIKVCGRSGHTVYNTLKKNAEYGFRELGHEIVDDNPDLLMTFGTAVSWDEIKDYKCKKVFLCHGVNWAKGPGDVTNEPIKELWTNCDMVVYSSKFAKYMAERAFGKKDGPFILNAAIPNFIKFEEWNEGETIHIATCSYVRAWKRVHELIRLVKGLNEKGIKVELHIIGGWNGNEESEVYPILPYLHYYGRISHEEIRAVYQKCHISAHLAFNDNSPATVGESMAWGIPVIITNSGGSKDILQDSGIVVNGDPFIDGACPITREDLLPKVNDEEFEKALLRMMRNLPEYRQKTIDLVISEANCMRQMEKVLDYYMEHENYLKTQETRGMTANRLSQELTPWIERFIGSYLEHLQRPILDIGSGDGGFVYRMNNIGKFAVGMDISCFSSEKGLINKVPIVLADVQKGIPFPDKVFKTVTMFHSFEHLVFPIKVIEEIKRVLSGKFCIIVPTQSGGDEIHGHYTYFNNMEKLREFLIKNEFEIIVEEDWGNMLCVIAKHG